MGWSENPCTRSGISCTQSETLHPPGPVHRQGPSLAPGAPGYPLVAPVPIQSGPSSRVGIFRSLTHPQDAQGSPWDPHCRTLLSGLYLDRQVPLQSGPGGPQSGPSKTPILGVPEGGIFWVRGAPPGTPPGGGFLTPRPGGVPGGRPGPPGVHFGGYLITLPVGTDVGIRNRKGWFSGGPRGGFSAPREGRKSAPRDPPGDPPKIGHFWPLRRPPK